MTNEEQNLLTLIKYRKEEKVSKSVRLPKSLSEELKNYAADSEFLRESDIVICALKKFLEEN